MIFYDTETCGLHGFPVLIQYAEDDGPITLYNIWKHPIQETLELIEYFMSQDIVGFNLAFDHFHLCKAYTTFSRYWDHSDVPEYLDMNDLANCEYLARDGKCLKPKGACDLMLIARKGPYQSTMDRHDIRIKKVPYQLAYQLAAKLEELIQLKDVYFARRKNHKVEKWQIEDNDDDPNFKDIILRFAPSSGLKALAIDALKADISYLFDDIGLSSKVLPDEYGWAPFAKAAKPGDQPWTDVIQFHIDHWEYDGAARQYAEDDVKYTRDLYRYFNCPSFDDLDSNLACMVAANRWRGFKINVPKIKELREEALRKQALAPTSPGRVKDWILPELNETEKAAVKGSTKKTVLESMREWVDPCSDCSGDGCEKCNNTGEQPHPAAIKAKAVLDARTSQKEVELYDKLIHAERLHASFKVIGAMSGRMSGADKLNPQGIKRTKDVRSCFPLAHSGMVLCGGDFESFEVVIAIANYNDPKLEKDVLTEGICPDCLGSGLDKGKECKGCSGSGKCNQKLHGLFAQALFPGENYDSIIATKGSDNDLYSKGKSGVFSQMYGGNADTLVNRLGISKESAEEAAARWAKSYPGIKKAQQRIFDGFCSMRQPGGLGTRVEWHDPDDYVESMLGFRRYFTLENQICKALFNLGESPPKDWLKYEGKVKRRDREQSVSGAVRSALFGAAFSIQSANMRAATNHVIQSTGAEITKVLQLRLWNIQPVGIHDWEIQLLNVHDEIMAPTKEEHIPKIEEITNKLIEDYKPIIPLISLDWGNRLETWASK